jgi:glycosyltransferase involved in cell wall biosynthesis
MAERRPHIVAFAHAASLRGGAELCLIEFVEHCLLRGVEVDVVVRKDDELAARARAAGATIHVMPVPHWMSLDHATAPWARVRRAATTTARVLRYGVRAARIVRRSGCDAVLSATLASPVGVIAARLARVPHSWWIMEFGDTDHGFQFDLTRPVTWRAVRLTRSNGIVMSRALEDVFRPAFGARRLELVYPAVEAPRVCPPPHRAEEEPLRLLHLGRLVHTKGAEVSVRALGELLHDGDRFRLRFVGPEEPSFRAEIVQLVDQLGVGHAVELSGRVPDQGAAICDSHVVLMCSRHEAFGRVTVEALKSGRPVVGTNTGGTAELIDDGVTGLLFDVESPVSLAAALRTFDDDPAQLARMSAAAAVDNADRFVPEVQHDALLAAILRPTGLDVPAPASR